ncbi:MAG: efflux RND transporter periplasmic adaptor subunit, partial [Limnobacter sp.]|nr:efflux RND transporter periplasmic adaptor subunit [Limnobacter sp.]
YISATIVVALHELAHGITCKHYGGRVPTMGVLLIMVSIPCFYTDVSDAWLFSKKRHRLWVTASGVFFESVLWGIAIFFWQTTPVSSPVHQFALGVILASSVGMLITLNPFLKFDGYYMLSDALEIPNLRDKSMAYVSLWMGSVLQKDKARLPRTSARERRIYMTFGVMCLLITFLILGSLLITLSGVMQTQWGAVALVPVLFLAYWLLGGTLSGIWEGMKPNQSLKTEAKYAMENQPSTIVSATGEPATPSSVTPIKPTKKWKGKLIAIALIGLIVGASQWFSGLLEVQSAFVLKPVQTSMVTSQVQGMAKTIHVSKGDRVKEGQPLVSLDTREIELQNQLATIEQRKAELALKAVEGGSRPEALEIKRAELASARTAVSHEKSKYDRLKQLANKSISSSRIADAKYRWQAAQREESVIREQLALLTAGNTNTEISSRQIDLERARSLVAQTQYQLEQSVIKAPIDGVIAAADPNDLQGRFIQSGEGLFEVQTVDKLKAVMGVAQRDVAELQLGQPVKLKVAGFPDQTLTGEITAISAVVSDGVVLGLPEKIVEVDVALANTPNGLKPGMTGKARIQARETSYFELAFGQLGDWFSMEFNW